MNKLTKLNKISLILYSFTALIIVYFTYKGLFRVFYQQDEWMGLGSFMSNGFIGTLRGVTFSQIITGAGRPLVIPLHYIFYHFFPFAVWPFASFSIILHTVNSILIYGIIVLLTQSIGAAWIAGILFAVTYNGSQAISWFAANTTTLPSTLFGLLSILLLLIHIRNKKYNFLLLAQISVVISYYFKESGFIFVLFLPIIYALSKAEKKILLNTFRIFSPIILFFSFVASVSVTRLLSATEQIHKTVGQSSGGIFKIFEHILYYPIITFSQLFIPFPLCKKINPLLCEVSFNSDVIFLSLSVVFLIVIILTLLKVKNYRKPILITLILTLLSFIPYAVLERGASYLDLRYFYTGIAGGSMLIGIFGIIVWNTMQSRSRKYCYLICIIGIGVFSIYAYKNIQFIRRDIQVQILDAEERTTILNRIKILYPTLPRNPVFYITGDHPGYYFIENQKIPFQQGIGYTLMVLYYPTGIISDDLLRSAGETFWGIRYQGYSEINGKGFGYYWDENIMKKDLINNGYFSKKQIIGLFYNNKTKTLEDITDSIQQKLP